MEIKTQKQLNQISNLKEHLLSNDDLHKKLKRITDAVVTVFGADFCRIWISRPGDLCDCGCLHATTTEQISCCFRDHCLHLVASSGRYTHLDGTHRRVPFGTYKIGRIACGEAPKFLSDDVVHDPRVHDHAWAKKNGLVSFAGYRLLSGENRPLGVLALFSKASLSSEEDSLLEDLANTTAHVIQTALAVEALQKSEEKYRALNRELTEGLSDVFKALKEIASGDPEVRISETSALPLITELKRAVNSTGENLSEIVNLSHEFAMGLAEHFDTLDRVSKGDLNARVTGPSQVELLEALKGVTNKMITNVSLDITRREQAECELRNSEKKFSKVFHSSPNLMAVSSLSEGRFIDVNEGFLRTTGYDREEVVHRTTAELNLLADHRDREKIIDVIDREGAAHQVELDLRMKDGSIRQFTFSAEVIDVAGEPCLLSAVVDITEQKKAEEERLQLRRQLQRAEKMEVVGTLAGGVAHDLNNILSGIVSYPDLILLDLPEDSPLREPMVTIRNSGQKAAAIVQDLLTLSRRGVTATEVTNLNDIIKEYLRSPEYEKLKAYHPDVWVETDLEEDLLNVLASPVHLSKTVMNLVSNAAEALVRGGEISISTANRYLDKSVRGYDTIKEGDYIVLTVTDNGIGISEKDVDRIFEPFYTKKIMGRSGTGLGMAVVWGTVKDLNGYIDVRSREGVGTTFKLYFPVTRQAAAKEKAVTYMKDYMGNGETILVVDDIIEQRQIATLLLTKLGYSVRHVSSGEEAVEFIKTERPDLLLLDMIMDPGMDGLDTYQRILERNPEQKAIIASGFSETDRVRKAQKMGAGQYVRKPYTLEKIGLAVKAELKK